MRTIINTLTDAETYYTNSGVIDWTWFDGFDENALIRYIYKNSDRLNNAPDDEQARDVFHKILAAFLFANGENPDDYGLGADYTASVAMTTVNYLGKEQDWENGQTIYTFERSDGSRFSEIESGETRGEHVTDEMRLED